jgi:uncharacterized protein YkwD
MYIDLQGVGRVAAVLGLVLLGTASPAAAEEREQPPVFEPPPLAADPAEVLAADRGARDDLRRLTSAATAAAPFTHQVLELVNEERLANGGLPPLKGVALLDSSAGGHSSRMATGDFFSHCDLDTLSSPSGRMQAAGYFGNSTGENIAAGSSTPQAVMALWMASQGHRENILRITFREMGVGYFQQVGDAANVRVDFDGNCTVDDVSGPFVHYWTQNFGRRDSVFPVVVERETWETSCGGVDLYTYGAGTFSQMRFSNDGATWSAWMPFSAEAGWTLPPGAGGTATVWAELGNGGGPLHQATDTIEIADDYPAAADLDLSAETVTTTESFTACDTLTAGDGFHVAATGDATFTARTIVLTDGFSVAAGGTFRAATR